MSEIHFINPSKDRRSYMSTKSTLDSSVEQAHYAFSLIFSNRITILSIRRFRSLAISRLFQNDITIFSNEIPRLFQTDLLSDITGTN